LPLELNEQQEKLPTMSLVGARIGRRDIDAGTAQVAVELYASNLFDKDDGAHHYEIGTTRREGCFLQRPAGADWTKI